MPSYVDIKAAQFRRIVAELEAAHDELADKEIEIMCLKEQVSDLITENADLKKAVNTMVADRTYVAA